MISLFLFDCSFNNIKSKKALTLKKTHQFHELIV